MRRSRTLLAVGQWLLLAAILYWASRALSGQWQDVRGTVSASNIAWGWVLLASLIVLGTYAMLIQSWRMLLAGWGGNLPFGAAVRIWTIANLGRYVPGKLWSVGALGILAKREGVSGVAAAGAAILGTLLNIGAGFGILALSGAQSLGAFSPWLQSTAIAVAIAFVLGTLMLPRVLPLLLRRVSRWRGVPEVAQQLPATTLWFATGINAASWVCYGAAFAAFARGVAPQVNASPALFIVIWTASYLLGYLVLIAPGGMVVREVAMAGAVVALGLATSAADATFLALASRLWLTVWEIVPGLLSLLITPRMAVPPDAASP